ncbi:hypothetical protein, partial [Klebsiella pneumoniae]|uniref:hypothetical protein n=2 Tax=Pseudomonadota TaxID=1224 RepID=UPI001954E3C8
GLGALGGLGLLPGLFGLSLSLGLLGALLLFGLPLGLGLLGALLLLGLPLRLGLLEALLVGLMLGLHL